MSFQPPDEQMPMDGMNGAGGPSPPDPAQDPGQAPAAPESEIPEGGFTDTIAEFAESARALAIQARALAGTDPEGAQRLMSGAFQGAQAMAVLNPPVKPIDPNLHADFRAVDPQRMVEIAHEQTMAREQRAHEQDMARLQAAQRSAATGGNGGNDDG